MRPRADDESGGGDPAVGEGLQGEGGVVERAEAAAAHHDHGCRQRHGEVGDGVPLVVELDQQPAGPLDQHVIMERGQPPDGLHVRRQGRQARA
jgi:hypothetical protein